MTSAFNVPRLSASDGNLSRHPQSRLLLLSSNANPAPDASFKWLGDARLFRKNRSKFDCNSALGRPGLFSLCPGLEYGAVLNPVSHSHGWNQSSLEPSRHSCLVNQRLYRPGSKRRVRGSRSYLGRGRRNLMARPGIFETSHKEPPGSVVVALIVHVRWPN